MIPQALNQRLKHLELHLAKILNLLNEYETEMLDEDDPGRKSKYSRRIEQLKEDKARYEREFIELKTQLGEEQPDSRQNIENNIQNINAKLDLLLDGHASLQQALLHQFSAKERDMLRPVTAQLDESQLMEIQAVLEAVDTKEISPTDIEQLLRETRQLLIELDGRVDLPNTDSTWEEIIAPALDTKHALKFSLPLIPFLLSYEAEVGLDARIDLKKTWKNFLKKFNKKSIREN